MKTNCMCTRVNEQWIISSHEAEKTINMWLISGPAKTYNEHGLTVANNNNRQYK